MQNGRILLAKPQGVPNDRLVACLWGTVIYPLRRSRLLQLPLPRGAGGKTAGLARALQVATPLVGYNIFGADTSCRKTKEHG